MAHHLLARLPRHGTSSRKPQLRAMAVRAGGHQKGGSKPRPRTPRFWLFDVLCLAFIFSCCLPPPARCSPHHFFVQAGNQGLVLHSPLCFAPLSLHSRSESVFSAPSLPPQTWLSPPQQPPVPQPPSALLASDPAPTLLQAARHSQIMSLFLLKTPRHCPLSAKLTQTSAVQALSCLGPCPFP